MAIVPARAGARAPNAGTATTAATLTTIAPRQRLFPVPVYRKHCRLSNLSDLCSFQNVVCEGVEEGLKGMRAGAKRVLLVPAALAPKGVDVPDGVKLKYEIELLEVLPGYF